MFTPSKSATGTHSDSRSVTNPEDSSLRLRRRRGTSSASLLGLTSLLCVALWGSDGFSQPSMNRADVVIVDRSQTRKDNEILTKIQQASVLLYSPYRSSTDMQQGLNLINEAIALAPERANTYFLAADLVLTSIGDYDTARSLMSDFLELAEPDDYNLPSAHEFIGELELSEARDHKPHVDEKALESSEGHFLAAYQFYVDRQDRRGMASIEARLCTVAGLRGDLVAALRYIKAAVEHNPPYLFGALIDESMLLVRVGRAKEAIELLESMGKEVLAFAQAIEAQHAFLIALSNAYRAAGEYEVAHYYVDLAEGYILGRDPVVFGIYGTPSAVLLAETYSLKGSIYFEQGKYDETEQLYRKAMDLETGKPVRMNNLAWVLVVTANGQDSRLEEAKRLAETAVEAEPSPAFLDTLAEIYLRYERYDEAKALLEDALDLEPDSEYLASQLAKIESAQAGYVAPSGSVTRVQKWEPPLEGL